MVSSWMLPFLVRRPAVASLLGLLLGAALGAPSQAWAEDTPEGPGPATAAVAELERTLDAPPPTWDELYRAYDDTKKAMEDASGADAEAAAAAYERIQPRVADALRRDRMPLSAWIMGIFGALLLWGGFAVCMTIAMRSTPNPELDGDETWPLRPEDS